MKISPGLGLLEKSLQECPAAPWRAPDSLAVPRSLSPGDEALKGRLAALPLPRPGAEWAPAAGEQEEALPHLGETGLKAKCICYL